MPATYCQNIVGDSNDIAKLALEDGLVFTGKAFGARGESDGEVVFNTSMTGYQEILTDPSYHGQILTMTYTQIGNTGVNEEDNESSRPWVRGFVVREISGTVSSYRATGSLPDFLEKHGVMGMSGIDTRMLVRHIRDKGAMKGVISTIDSDDASLVAKAKASPGLIGRDLTREVMTPEPYTWETGLDPTWLLAPIDPVTQDGDAPGRGAGRCISAARHRARLRAEAEHPAEPGRDRLQGDGHAGLLRRRRPSSNRGPTAFSSRTGQAIRRQSP